MSGICNIEINGLADAPRVSFTSELENFYFTTTQTNNSLIINYVIPSGESLLTNVLMIQESAFADDVTICNTSLISSASSIECFVNETIGDSSVSIKIVSDDDLKGVLRATFEEDLNSSFLLNNYFIAAVILMTLVLMFVSSPIIMIASSVFGFIFLGFVFIIKSSTVGLTLGASAWLIVSLIVIISKMNKKVET